MDIQQESVAEFRTGQLTATTTPQSLPAMRAVKGVRLKGTCIVNGGYQLDGELFIPVDDSGKVSVHTASGTAVVSYLIT
jgi:hypothetical protein